MYTPELAPVVTPALAKKLTSGKVNLDDLSEGIHPFILMIQDHTTGVRSKAFADAGVSNAANYDDIMHRQGLADLANIRLLKASTKVLIPETYALAQAMLQAFVIVITAILGTAHPQVANISRFVTAYVNHENFYIGHLQRCDSNLGSAQLLHYMQLAVRVWFQNMLLVNDTANAALVPSSDYCSILQKMNMGDMTWLPEIHKAYLKPTTIIEDCASEDKKGSKGKDGNKKPLQVLDTFKNQKFDEFCSKIATVKFNKVIKKAGQPPSIQQNGKDTPMCTFYHL